MEENKLVPKGNDDTVFDSEIYGVKVERRRKRKRKGIRIKRLLIIACIACLLILVIKNFENICGFFSSVFSSSGEEQAVSSSNNSSNDFKNDSGNENNGEENENIIYDYEFIDTSPTEFSIINKNLIVSDITKLTYTLPKSKDIYDMYGKDAPLVLIVNMSPSECYSDGNGYSKASVFYNSEKNVSALGEQLCASLNSIGINAIHLIREYGNISLSEYQKEYVEAIESLLANNPSISYIFDISRGLSINSDMSINCERTELNGASIPTVSFVCGTNGTSTTELQNRSIYFAYDLASSINKNAPLLVSTLNLAERDLNLQFSTPCIRIEIGSYACTFEEASLVTDYLALAISSYMLKQ